MNQDTGRYTKGEGFFNCVKTLSKNPGARFMLYLRGCKKYNKKNPLGVLYRMLFALVSSRYNVELPHTTSIGQGLYFGHFKNITINQNTVIGENCNIMQGVTIGNESRGKRKGTPIIGDRVLIGPNSVVVGKIKIGNDALIAPLTFVNFDVPANAVVLGNPAKIIGDNGSSGYLKNLVG